MPKHIQTRSHAVALDAARAVTCPVCRARPGEHCRAASGALLALDHGPRRALALIRPAAEAKAPQTDADAIAAFLAERGATVCPPMKAAGYGSLARSAPTQKALDVREAAARQRRSERNRIRP